ncbi:MAG: glycosyltransferase family 2 protein [Crenarchaeota archaeon]|nr:glycosyltransferase family 2 protein [Thermoproteota archaeon]
MAWLTTLALALVAAGLLWGSSYSLAIYVASSRRGGDAASSSRGRAPRFISIIVPARGEPLRMLSSTLLAASSSCSGLGEVIAVIDDPLPRVLELAREVGSRGFPGNLVVVARLWGSGGRNGAMNDGVRLSRGDLVMVIDADVRVSREVIEEASRCEDVCVAPWRSYAVYNTRAEQATRFATDLGTWIFYVLKHRLGLFIYPLGAGTAIDRGVIEGIGLWRTDVIQDDIWLGTQLASRGIKPRVLPRFIEVTTPPTLEAAAIQLSRWSYGASDVLRRFWRCVARSPLRAVEKAEALLYIAQPLQSVIATAGLVIGVAAAVLERGIPLLYPGFICVAMVFAAVSAAYSYIARVFAESWGERLYVEKMPFLMGRYSALMAVISPILAASTISGLLGLRARYRVTPKEVGSREVPRLAIASTVAWGACLALSIATGNVPMALTYLAMVAAGIYCCTRFRGGG